MDSGMGVTCISSRGSDQSSSTRWEIDWNLHKQSCWETKKRTVVDSRLQTSLVTAWEQVRARSEKYTGCTEEWGLSEIWKNKKQREEPNAMGFMWESHMIFSTTKIKIWTQEKESKYHDISQLTSINLCRIRRQHVSICTATSWNFGEIVRNWNVLHLRFWGRGGSPSTIALKRENRVNIVYKSNENLRFHTSQFVPKQFVIPSDPHGTKDGPQLCRLYVDSPYSIYQI